MRILITGAGGLLGGRLCELLRTRHDVVGATRRSAAPDSITAYLVDLTDAAAVSDLVRRARPDAVIHCAALADPEVCEKEPDRAMRENEGATRVLASATAAARVRLIAISTDLVFDGASRFSNENASPRPLSVYGRSKLCAERVCLSEAPSALIVRLPLLVGRGHGARRTASEGIAQRISRGEPVTLYRDEWRTPVDPESVAAALSSILEREWIRGILHVAGAERLSRLELGHRVAAKLGLDASLIRSASRVEHQGAPRAEDVSLDISRGRSELDWTPRLLDETIGEGRIV